MQDGGRNTHGAVRLARPGMEEDMASGGLQVLMGRTMLVGTGNLNQTADGRLGAGQPADSVVWLV